MNRKMIGEAIYIRIIDRKQSLKRVSTNTMSFDKGKQSSNQVNRNESPIGRLKRACDYWQSSVIHPIWFSVEISDSTNSE
jgi:hypothetical protein